MQNNIFQFFYRIEISEDFTVSLEIRETQTTDAGCYVINIENEFGSDSAQAEVTIDFAAPRFTSALSDLRVTLNDNARFECAYDGLPLPDVTWLVSGLSVANSDKYQISTEEQQKRSRLEVTRMTLDDAEMTYACRATNVVGEAMTSAQLVPQGAYPSRSSLRFYCLLPTPPSPACRSV